MNKKLKKSLIIGGCIVLSIVAITTVGIIKIVQNSKEKPPVVEVVEMNKQLNEKLVAVMREQGTGNDKYYNEITRNPIVTYVINNELDLNDETLSTNKTYATIYVNYNYDITYGEGDDADVEKNTGLKSFSIELDAETVETLNNLKSVTNAELISLVNKAFGKADIASIKYDNDPTGVHMDDTDYYTLKEGIKTSILDNNQEYMEFTDAANVTVLNIYNDDANNTYNVLGVVTEGNNSKYFMFSKTYSTYKELVDARESVANISVGEKMQDNNFTMLSANDAMNAAVVSGVDGKFYTIYVCNAKVPNLFIDEPVISK